MGGMNFSIPSEKSRQPTLSLFDAAEKAKAVIESNYNTSDGFDFEFADDKVVVMEPDVTKFDQNWMVAKYKIVSDLRTINGVDRVDFVQIWDAGAKE